MNEWLWTLSLTQSKQYHLDTTSSFTGLHLCFWKCLNFIWPYMYRCFAAYVLKKVSCAFRCLIFLCSWNMTIGLLFCHVGNLPASLCPRWSHEVSHHLPRHSSKHTLNNINTYSVTSKDVRGAKRGVGRCGGSPLDWARPDERVQTVCCRISCRPPINAAFFGSLPLL